MPCSAGLPRRPRFQVPTLKGYCRPRLPYRARATIRYSHPEWLVARWISRFGLERTGQLLQANNRPPPLSCAVLDPEDMAAVTASLKEKQSAAGGARLEELPHPERFPHKHKDEREASQGRWL